MVRFGWNGGSMGNGTGNMGEKGGAGMSMGKVAVFATVVLPGVIVTVLEEGLL